VSRRRLGQQQSDPLTFRASLVRDPLRQVHPRTRVIVNASRDAHTLLGRRVWVPQTL